MADIDSRFITTSDVDTYYVDKDTGRPLAAGKVTFYSDVNRTQKKNVYQLTGSPGAYTYEPLPNPSTLSGVGTFQDELGNNIVPYYFPYQGLPALTNNQIELYYITVESAEGVDQLTRQAWPNFGGDSAGDQSKLINFIPNGQFLIHNDITSPTQPPSQTFGNFTAQPIAQGGWLFLTSVGGSSTFNNSFQEIQGAISGINDFPRYAFNFSCTSFSSSNSVRDLAISWPDVNKFSAGDPEGTLPYTFSIEAESNDSNTYVFDVRLIRYFGTGGVPSPTSDTSIGSFTVTPSYSYFTLFIPGIAGDTGVIGTNNDDRIFITLRGPSSSWNIQTTGWVFTPGNVDITNFPTMTNAEMLSQTLMGWVDVPNPNGDNLGLKPALTLQGMQWDESEVGEIKTYLNGNNFTGSLHNSAPLMICDGNVYPTDGYSPLGIPYRRLYNYLLDPNTGLTTTGTGNNFVTCYLSGGLNNIRLTTNSAGLQAPIFDGTSPTGFSFSTLFNGISSIGMIANVCINGNTVFLSSTVTGTGGPDAETFISAGTSGFTTTIIYQTPGANGTYFNYTVRVGSLPSAGTYFTFYNATGGYYYVWFTVNGSGSDPSIGGATGIEVPLLSGYSVYDCCSLIREAINGFQASYVICNAASSMTAPCYFQFNANGVAYQVSYYIDGIGESFLGGLNIPVFIASTATSDQVAAATVAAINSFQFAAPNFTGMFLRCVNPGAYGLVGENATDTGLRYGINNTADSQGYGTYQYSDNRNHSHVLDQASSQFVIMGPNFVQFTGTLGEYVPCEGNFLTTPSIQDITRSQGGLESRPINVGVLYAIKY